MIAIVKSDFNTEITALLLQGCEDQLTTLGKKFKTFTCPGAVETVAYSKFLIDKNQFEAIIVIGAIIKGDTDHYEYVCQYVTNGISHLSALSPIPIIFGILTTQNEELADSVAQEQGYDDAVWVGENMPAMHSLWDGNSFTPATTEYLISIGVITPIAEAEEILSELN